jgi:hypothetical protein
MGLVPKIDGDPAAPRSILCTAAVDKDRSGTFASTVLAATHRERCAERGQAGQSRVGRRLRHRRTAADGDRVE